MFAIYQQHMVVGQAWQTLLHQGTHVVKATHLLRQQDQGRRGVVAFEGLHLDSHLVVGQGSLEQVAQFLGVVLTVRIGQFTLLFL